MKKYLIIIFIFFNASHLVLFAVIDKESVQLETGFKYLAFSPLKNMILFEDDRRPGLSLLSLENNQTQYIFPGQGCAYRASWSPDGRFVLFKLIEKSDAGFLQTPSLYDLQTQRIIPLCPPAQQAGIPSVSAAEKIAFTIELTLYITNLSGQIEQTFQLPAYSNQTPISPDGKYVIYNDKRDRLFLLQLTNGQVTPLPFEKCGLFEPIWSPDGSAIVASSLNGQIILFDLNTGQTKELGSGRHPSWSDDGQWIIFSRTEVIETVKLVNSDLFLADRKGNNLQRLTDSEEWEDFGIISTKTGKIFYSDFRDSELIHANFSWKNRSLQIKEENAIKILQQSNQQNDPTAAESKSFSESQTGFFFDIPYVHQAYDTPDWFNGNSACGATAASMCLGYYDLLQAWPVWVSSPNKHLSEYGNYICNVYSSNSYTFNIWAYDPNGVRGYGGFGHIVRNGSQAWSDTKGYMADYARRHGLASEVDWSPTRQKLVGEANSKKPFVLLNSLTSAGHYISVIGYENPDATSIIVNDPYGNKNVSYPSANGRRVKYDWPGYSNGYSNLNTVWCFIYFRGEVPLHPDLNASNLIIPDTINVGKPVFFSLKIGNWGDGQSLPCSAAALSSGDTRYDQNDSLLFNFEIAALASGDSLGVEHEFVFSDSLTSNDYYFGVYVDRDTVNREMVRENNVVFKRAAVKGFPRIYSVNPAINAKITNNKPTIYASFRDKFDAIDTATVRMLVNGADVTSFCQKTNNKITYIPQQSLVNGWHTVRVAATSVLGHVANKDWSFEVAAQTAIDNSITSAPDRFTLEQNYPNPFNASTKISFALPQAGLVSLAVFDINGNRVRTLFDGFKNAGAHEMIWQSNAVDGKSLASGIYFIKLEFNGQRLMRRVLLVK